MLGRDPSESPLKFIAQVGCERRAACHHPRSRVGISHSLGLKTGISGGLSPGAKSSAKPCVVGNPLHCCFISTREASTRTHVREVGLRGPRAGMSSCVKSLNRQRLTLVGFRTLMRVLERKPPHSYCFSKTWCLTGSDPTPVPPQAVSRSGYSPARSHDATPYSCF